MIVKNMYILLFVPPECVGQRAILYVNIFFYRTGAVNEPVKFANSSSLKFLFAKYRSCPWNVWTLSVCTFSHDSTKLHPS